MRRKVERQWKGEYRRFHYYVWEGDRCLNRFLDEEEAIKYAQDDPAYPPDGPGEIIWRSGDGESTPGWRTKWEAFMAWCSGK